MSRASLPVVLSDAETIRLEQWIRAGSTPQQVVLRARIILGAAQGQTDKTTAMARGVRRETAALWRRRVREQGIGCVWEDRRGAWSQTPRRGRSRRTVERRHAPDPTDRRDALEHTHDGPRSRGQQKHASAGLAGSRTEAASDQKFQTFP